MERPAPCGILPVDKPEGFTSFDVIAKLRGLLRVKRLGHAGTLDPMATGVLPVFVGTATRACDCASEGGKRYTAEMRLGVVTDTQDITGKVLAERPVDVTGARLDEVCARFRGRIAQVPPMYSAVSVGGKRLYELAREGREIERPAREVEITRLDIMAADLASGVVTLDVGCSKGTYIRTLCHDIGAALGCGAAVSALRRTESGAFTLEQCVTLADIQRTIDAGGFPALLPVETAFGGYPAVRLPAWEARLFENGVKLRPEQASGEEGTLLRVYGEGFLGLGRMEDGGLRAVKIFIRGEGACI